MWIINGVNHCFVCFQKIIREGFAAYQVLIQFHDRVISMDDVSDKQKSVMCEKMGVSGRLNCGVRD